MNILSSPQLDVFSNEGIVSIFTRAFDHCILLTPVDSNDLLIEFPSSELKMLFPRCLRFIYHGTVMVIFVFEWMFRTFFIHQRQNRDVLSAGDEVLFQDCLSNLFQVFSDYDCVTVSERC